jgi:hypothetical protein
MKKILFILAFLPLLVSGQPIFETDFEHGSYIERVSGDEMTNTNGVFVRTEKGIAWKGNGSNSKVTLGSSVSLGTVFTFEIWAKINPNSNTYNAFAGYNNTSYPLAWNPLVNNLYTHDGTSATNEAKTVIPNKWTHFLVTRNGTSVYFYVDNIGGIEQTLASNNPVTIDRLFERNGILNLYGECAKIRAWDHILSEKERVIAYRDFLNAGPVISEKFPKQLPEHKPQTLNDNGLVAAYNFIPSGNTLVDISGNGKNGTITDATQTISGLIFDGLNDYVDIQNGALIEFANYTISGRLKINDLMAGDGVVYQNDSESADTILNSIGIKNGKISWNYTSAGTYKAGATNAIPVNEWVDFCFISNGGRRGIINLYMDGVEETITSTTYYRTGTRTGIGAQNVAGSQFFNGAISDFRIYNYPFTEQDAIDYHNSFVETVLVENFEYDPVGKFPSGWVPGASTYTIRELTAQDAVLTQLDAGTKYLFSASSNKPAAIESKTAYGTWEFGFYNDDNVMKGIRIPFISDRIASHALTVGYSFTSATGMIGIYRSTGSGGNTIMASGASYVVDDTYYMVKITRNKAGVFTMWIKGGDFGPEYVLADASGGGANPSSADNTYKTSEYFVNSSDENTRIYGITIWNGIKQ